MATSNEEGSLILAAIGSVAVAVAVAMGELAAQLQCSSPADYAISMRVGTVYRVMCSSVSGDVAIFNVNVDR